MKVLYAFPEPLPLQRARGVQLAHAVTGLARQGVDIELAHVPAQDTHGNEGAQEHPIRHYGLDVPPGLALTSLSRSLPWPLSRWHSNRAFLHRLETRIAALQKEGPVMLMTRHLKLAAMLARRHAGLPLVYEAHEVFGDTAQPDKQAVQSAMEAEVMQHAALVIANSGATATRLQEKYGARDVAVLANGVDWPASLPDKDWDHAGRHIVYSGSFFAWKGVSDLVQAAAHLPGCRITLLGGTAEQIAREQALRANGGAEKRALRAQGGAEIEFRGHVAHAEVAQALAQACIAVLPNRDDPDSRFTSPIKLYEYMAAGCAIVASDLPALRDILPPDAAAWVKPGDVRSLAEGIRGLTADPGKARALGARVREQARALTWQARAEKLAALLRGVRA